MVYRDTILSNGNIGVHGAPNGNGHGRRPVRGIVLAGGLGTRLAPFTNILPKPLMPIGDRSILELILEQLAGHGVAGVTLCLGHLSHLIQAVIDGRPCGGMPVDYVREEQALGTAGPLRLIEPPEDTVVALNGDVLTDLDFAELVRRHRHEGNAVTVATRNRHTRIEYGVLRVNEDEAAPRVTAWEEKPEFVARVSMGIYAIEPWVLEYIPEGRRYDVPDLVRALIADGHRVGTYDHEGLWFDIGKKEDYEQALEIWLGSAAPNGAAQNGHRSNGSGHGGNGAHVDAVPTTIVTAGRGEAAVGAAARAFSTLSVQPPLVMVALDPASGLLQHLQETGRFAVNLLPEGHTGDEPGSPWVEEDGLPRLEGATAFFTCDVESVVPGDGQVAVVGRVTVDDRDGLPPLVYRPRRFMELVR